MFKKFLLLVGMVMLFSLGCTKNNESNPIEPGIKQMYAVGGIFKEVWNTSKSEDNFVGVAVFGPMIPYVSLNNDTLPFRLYNGGTYWDSTMNLVCGDTYNLKVDFLEFGNLNATCKLPNEFNITTADTLLQLGTAFNGTWTPSDGADWYWVDFYLSYDYIDASVIEEDTSIVLVNNGPPDTFYFPDNAGFFTMKDSSSNIYISAPGGVYNIYWWTCTAPEDSTQYQQETRAWEDDRYAIISDDAPHYAQIYFGWFDYHNDTVTCHFTYSLQTTPGHRNICKDGYFHFDTTLVAVSTSFSVPSSILFPWIETGDSVYYSYGYLDVSAINGPIPQPGSYGNIQGDGYGFFIGAYFPEGPHIHIEGTKYKMEQRERGSRKLFNSMRALIPQLEMK